MSNTKTVMGQAANTQGIPLDIPDVFSTYLYTGTGAAQTITNGIDLDGEGGLVWVKNRDQTDNHYLFGSDSNWASTLTSNSTGYYGGAGSIFDGVSSTGFTVKSDFGGVNTNGEDYASWSFRKAPKFFDVQTYTGDGTDERDIEHNLGGPVGCLMVKCTSESAGWQVLHKDANRLVLDSTAAQYSVANTAARFGNDVTITRPTSTHFTVSTPGNADTNKAGATYVAYIFAHNDGDGEFGPSGDQDIIKCGSYTGNGSSSGVEVDLGFEPQWILAKSATQTSTNWTITDVMRGWTVGNGQNYIYPHTSAVEVSPTTNLIDPLPNGFKVFGTGSNFNTSGQTYIYMAIRRGPLYPPEAADEVFEPAITYDESNDPGYNSGFVTDMFWYRNPSSADEMRALTRLTQGKVLRMDQAIAETGNTSSFDFMDGADAPVNDSFKGWLWKRAPSYFDCVAYTGTGSARTVSHNLGVAPEMMWVKARESAGGSNRNWAVYSSTLGAGQQMWLNTTDGAFTSSTIWANTAPTETSFSVSTNVNTNYSNVKYIAYLFATLAGISKVGSVTHSGTTNVDCGFSAGSRFVMLKRTDATGGWYIWDSVRGIIAGNDPYLLLNTTAAQVTNTDYIDPLSSGFTITSNFTAGDYIFYAIA